MTYTLTLNPLIIVQFAAVAQTLVMALVVSIPRPINPSNRRIAAAVEFLKVIGYCTAGVFAALFIDTGVAWLAGTWGYADWRYQLPSAMLLVITGADYFLAGLLKRGNWIVLVYVACTVSALLVFLHVSVPAETVMGPMLEEGLPVLLGALVGGGVVVAAIEAGRVARQQDRKWRGSWDVSSIMDRVFSKWTNLVIWGLLVAQGVLMFSGYSLLTVWIP